MSVAPLDLPRVAPPAASAPSLPAGPVTLGRLLTVAGPDALRVVCAPDGLDARVCRIPLWDLGWTAPVAFADGDLLLVTTPPGPELGHRLRGLVRRAAQAGVTGLVVRQQDLDEDWLATAVAGELAVLIANPEVSSADLRRRLLAAVELGADAAAQPADLHALVEAVATELGTTLLVTDDQLRPLAHHVAGEVDAGVRDWIVLRTPPAAVRGRLPARGRLLGLGRGADLLTEAGWTLVVVRVGTEVLGGIWAADAPPEGAAVLRLAARRAAGLLTTRGTSPDPDQRLRSDLLHAALTGSASHAGLGLTEGSGLRLLALRAPAGESTQRLEDLVSLRAHAASPRAAVTRMGEHVYVLAPADLDLGALGAGARCAVSGPLDGEELTDVRADLDRLLRLSDAPTVVGVEEHRSRLVLTELVELAGRHPGLRRGAVSRLAEIDAAQSTSYLPTLRAYFGTGHDLQQAANQLYVHRNTLRYRLDRVRALTGLDLDDPVQQLIADLQLRMHDADHLLACTASPGAVPRAFEAGSIPDEEQDR